MSDLLFNNLLKAETWRIAADLNHILHPFAVAKHPASSGDRVGGVALLAFSLLFIIPGCLYLYWVCKKVEQVNSPYLQSTDAKAQNVAAPLKSVKPQPAASKTRVKSIDETNLTFMGEVDVDVKNAFIKVVNAGLNRQNSSISKDVKILIYYPLARHSLSIKEAILKKIAQENVSHIVVLQKNSHLTLSAIVEVDIPIYYLNCQCKLERAENDEFRKRYDLEGPDFNQLLKDIALP